MGTNRVEAFSDGVIAIIITIMVLALQVPREASWAALLRVAPSLLSYALSFVVVAIMWVNHHYLLRLAKHADAHLLWANNFLLFWMSLIPFVTADLGRNHTAPFAVALYGAVLALAAAAFTWLRHVINRHHRHDDEMNYYNRRMLRKSAFSTALYASSIPLAYASIRLSFLVFVLIPVLYFLPERRLAETGTEKPSTRAQPSA